VLPARPGQDPCHVDQLITPLTPDLKGLQGSPGTFVCLGLVFIPIN
jgi:hypothetical protein